MIGQTLAHYRIESRLGEGGMGVVYLAHDTHLGRSVAIKILPPDRVADPDRKRRFVREATAASALTHPNIITIHDIDSSVPNGLADAAPVDFIVMEHIEGQSLDQIISKGPIESGKVLAYSLQIAAALSAAHAAGIVHRDIKPANIMLTSAGLIKVLDFGLAKLIEPVHSDPDASTLIRTLTKEGVILGTVAYMSPEQAEGKSLDPRSDVFSFGIVLFEMLTQKRPFQGKSQLSILSAILHQPPPDLKKFRNNVPREIQRIVSRCLEKDPAARYSSANELWKDLQDLESSTRTLGIKSLVRKPRVAVPALLLLIAIVAAGIWFGVGSYRTRWAHNVGLPQIARLLEQEDFDSAFRLGKQVEQYIPNDPQLMDLQHRYAKAALVESHPAGADVYVKGYSKVDGDWIYVGKTPVNGIPVPASYLRWKVTKEGFSPVEGAFHPFFPVRFALHSPNVLPSRMVSVPPGGGFKFRGLRTVELEGFWLDKYEVTNKQFRDFIDQGGYRKPEYWKHPFVKDGKVISWEQAMSEFRDATGQPGPSSWQLGSYPEKRDEFPVNGVSWYEAAAYAEFAGKSLPTIHHWFRAAELRQFSDILRFSNFSGQGPSEVGSHSGLGPYGSYDMAGNVREWCWNQVESVEGGPRYILGASWADAPYVFDAPFAANPWDRSATNGFRCVKYDTTLASTLTAPVENVSRDYTKEKPANEEVFGIFRNFYSYERKALNARVESVDDSAQHWRRETISFDAAYPGERVLVHLFVPKNVDPPYQTIVYFPSSLALLAKSSDELELGLMDFLPRIGRAVLYPVYKGTYERHLNTPPSFPPERDLMIAWSRDFSRSIDYLETRPDINHQMLGSYNYSGFLMPVLTAIDGRIKASALVGNGLLPMSLPPECDTIHFASRAKEPTLMIGGRHDFIMTLENSQRPMFRLLGASEKDKRLVLFDTGHVVWPGPEVIKEILAWFDRYLGPVNTK